MKFGLGNRLATVFLAEGAALFRPTVAVPEQLAAVDPISGTWQSQRPGTAYDAVAYLAYLDRKMGAGD